MAAPSEYRAILGGEPRPVEVPTIEHELTQLWKAAAEDTLGGRPVVRACVLNVVVYVSNRDAAEHINEVISQASRRHPSRSIVIVAGPDAGSARLQASISAHCQIPPEGGKQVCCEQITFHASGRALDELHGTVLPLLVPDLPVFLWWHDEPPLTGHLFQELLETCDRLVVDSADFAPERAGPGLVHLQRLAQEGDVAVSDLNWSRLTHWRELVAQFFDAPPARRYLDRLDRVEIEVTSLRGREPDLTAGLLLVGWLASRLGWALEDGGRRSPEGVLTFGLTSAAGPVAVEIRPTPPYPGEGVRSIHLEAAGGAAFAVTRPPDDQTSVAVTAEMAEGSHSRVTRMDPPSEAALLCDELDSMGRDTVFEEALAHAVQFMKSER
jgi:glucose-6-phosphate dehydrogenase assembly protein OpcA